MATACVVVPLGPACVDITGVRAGDQNLMSVTLTSAGVPFDLTGREVTAQARLNPLAVEALDAVVDIADPASGQVMLRWPGDEVTALLAGKTSWKGVWDLQVGQTGSDPVTFAAGKFSAVMDVTR